MEIEPLPPVIYLMDKPNNVTMAEVDTDGNDSVEGGQIAEEENVAFGEGLDGVDIIVGEGLDGANVVVGEGLDGAEIDALREGGNQEAEEEVEENN